MTERSRWLLRIVLGQLQIFGAVITPVFFWRTGASALSLSALGVTAVFLLVSLVMKK